MHRLIVQLRRTRRRAMPGTPHGRYTLQAVRTPGCTPPFPNRNARWLHRRSSSLMWLSSSYHILQSGARAALILLFTQLWQRAGRKRPECRIKDSVLPPCRKVHREPFQLLCKNHQPFPQMVVMWSIYMGNKTVGAIKKNAVHDLSVCPQLPMAMSTSTTTTAMAMRQPQPLPSPPPPPPLL